MSEEENTQEEPISISNLIQENLEKVTKEAAEFKEKYFRALAEMENTRKRLQQEKQEMIGYAVGNMLSEFLIPLDNLENALRYTDNLSDELKNWAHGFKMIAQQFTSVLENHGIVPFDSLGKKFDPHFHEAVEIQESDDYPNDSIIAEVQKGYRQKDRILRVAKVKVCRNIENESPECGSKQFNQQRGDEHDKKEK